MVTVVGSRRHPSRRRVGADSVACRRHRDPSSTRLERSRVRARRAAARQDLHGLELRAGGEARGAGEASRPATPSEIAGYLEVVPDVGFPAFGTPARDQAVETLFAARSDDALLAEYEPLYRKAREVVGNSRTPYLAAATLETWLRSQGGFVYEERPEQPAGATPPLVDFVLRTQEGYCQHYAGAMAVMLRLLGIPARVAVGFTSGEYDDRRNQWEVTDHNAHAWVEVYFPGYGWLPFDPTPGRGNLAGAYSTSSRDFPVGGPTALGIAPNALNAILRQRLAGGRGVEGAGSVSADALAGEESGGGIGIAGLVFILIGGILVLLFAAKALRRRLRFVVEGPAQGGLGLPA